MWPCTTVEEGQPLGRKVSRIKNPARKHVITRLRESRRQWRVSYILQGAILTMKLETSLLFTSKNSNLSRVVVGVFKSCRHTGVNAGLTAWREFLKRGRVLYLNAPQARIRHAEFRHVLFNPPVAIRMLNLVRHCGSAHSQS